jgi:fumarylacetoacetase
MTIQLDHPDFSIHNLPYGIFSTKDKSHRVGMAIGKHILDLAALAELGVFDFDTNVLRQAYLNDFIALGKEVTAKLRTDVQNWLADKNSFLFKKPYMFVEQNAATMHLPVRIGDYTDFYSSIEHATNVGKMFRDPANALLPNWKHLPVGYHGRSSSIVVSGTPIRRPKGQVMPKGASSPVFQASARLDFELEMAFIVGKQTELGSNVSTENAEEHIFGMVIFNDWSARDIQQWEYVPLGPFLGKNFASSISPWVVTMEALEPFRVAGPTQVPTVLPYLQFEGDKNYDIQLEVGIRPEGEKESIVCNSNFIYMYWNMSQQLAHHTVNGCNIKVGDMMASGTISGRSADSYGSMLELSWAGTQPIPLSDGSTRSFLLDGDTVAMRARAEKNGLSLGFGEVSGKILPAC